MNEAIIVFSRKGLFTTNVSARDIHSHEHARKLWPLVTPSAPRLLVTWVKPSFDENNKLIRKSHFRKFSDKRNLRVDQIFNQEETARYNASKESPEHSQAKQLIAEALQVRLKKGLAMPWYFNDNNSFDFHFAGNLLLGAENVSVEKRVKTSFGCEYRLDIAITSKKIDEKTILLGGVEIEWAHQFDGRKALIGKSQAFPLISIDISGMSLNEITPEWADLALTATTHSSEIGERKTYIYLHDLLYPLYLQLPTGLIKESRHQFLVFAPDDELKKLERWAKKLQELVGLNSKAMDVSIVNAISDQSIKMLENAGQVVGCDWEQVNSKKCLRLTVDRPSQLDVPSHMFHIHMAKLLLSHTDSLIGYKYKTDIQNNDPNEDVWRYAKWNPESKSYDFYRILPKRLAEPRSRIIDVLNSLDKSVSQPT